MTVNWEYKMCIRALWRNTTHGWSLSFSFSICNMTEMKKERDRERNSFKELIHKTVEADRSKWGRIFWQAGRWGKSCCSLGSGSARQQASISGRVSMFLSWGRFLLLLKTSVFARKAFNSLDEAHPYYGKWSTLLNVY